MLKHNRQGRLQIATMALISDFCPWCSHEYYTWSTYILINGTSSYQTRRRRTRCTRIQYWAGCRSMAHQIPVISNCGIYLCQEVTKHKNVVLNKEGFDNK